MHHTKTEPVSRELLVEPRTISPYDPEHLPSEIEVIETFRRHSKLTQLAGFDMAFHYTSQKD